MLFLDPGSDTIGCSTSSLPTSFMPSVLGGISVDADDFRLSPISHASHFSFHLLHQCSKLLDGYWNLRSYIFCKEQHLFESSDCDNLDSISYPIVAVSHKPNYTGKVIGVVRIFEQSHRHWQGGRLGVHCDFRPYNQIGKGLIWKAVTIANGWGCDHFLATVQIQNVRFFQRLHWASIDELDIKGVKHHLMEADLSYYTPSDEQRPALLPSP